MSKPAENSIPASVRPIPRIFSVPSMVLPFIQRSAPNVIYYGIYHFVEAAMTRTAKLFRNGRSQAVRLPSEYRFHGSEVYIRQDPATGDVILSRRPESWEEFFELTAQHDVPEGFMSDREDQPPQKRELF
jgi:antitoxin VapB